MSFKKTLVGLAVATGLVLSAGQSVMAEERNNGYVGLGAIEWKSKADGLPSYASNTARLRGGYHLTDHIAIEGHLAAGGNEKDKSGIEHELKHVAGGFVRFSTPDTKDIKAYGLLGVSQVEVNHINPFVEGDISETSLSYGIGVEILLMGGFSLKVDAIRYADTSELEFDAVGGEIGLRF